MTYALDNPIIHEPSLTARYLTHYVFNADYAAVGTVEYQRDRKGNYFSVAIGGEEIFRVQGQTEYLTSEDIATLEDEGFWLSLDGHRVDFTLHPIQINHLRNA